jgi:hypothetical protein
VRRLWARDKSVWTGSDEDRWLGWLDSVAQPQKKLGDYPDFADQVRREQFTDAVVLGMGGLSLGPEVLGLRRQAQLAKTADPRFDRPSEVKASEAAIDLARTLFIVSSKSGTTTEPNMLKDYFRARASDALGRGQAGAHFVAITDPGANADGCLRSRREGGRGLGPGGRCRAGGLAELVRKLGAPHAIWVMLLAGVITQSTIRELGQLLDSGDTIIAGGNRFWKDDIRREAALRELGLHYVDVGTSGGIWSLERGYCMMIGGKREPRPNLRGARARQPAAHERTRRPRSARGVRLHSCRAERRRPFRQDGGTTASNTASCVAALTRNESR